MLQVISRLSKKQLLLHTHKKQILHHKPSSPAQLVYNYLIAFCLVCPSCTSGWNGPFLTEELCREGSYCLLFQWEWWQKRTRGINGHLVECLKIHMKQFKRRVKTLARFLMASSPTDRLSYMCLILSSLTFAFILIWFPNVLVKKDKLYIVCNIYYKRYI